MLFSRKKVPPIYGNFDFFLQNTPDFETSSWIFFFQKGKYSSYLSFIFINLKNFLSGKKSNFKFQNRGYFGEKKSKSP